MYMSVAASKKSGFSEFSEKPLFCFILIIDLIIDLRILFLSHNIQNDENDKCKKKN